MFLKNFKVHVDLYMFRRGNMEPTIRGLVEKYLDEMLTNESLQEMSKTIDHYRPIIKSKEDAMFGFILGSVRLSLALYVWSLYRRLPSESENQELTSMTHKRAMEIRSKIVSSMK
jgi:hypothetical protein